LSNRELNITVGKELGKIGLKNIILNLKSKNSAEKIIFSINNTVSKVEKIIEDKQVTQEEVNADYKLVYSYPFNENFKIKVIKSFKVCIN